MYKSQQINKFSSNDDYYLTKISQVIAVHLLPSTVYSAVPSAPVPNCLGSEVSRVRSVLTPPLPGG